MGLGVMAMPVRKILLPLCCAVALFAGCSDDDAPSVDEKLVKAFVEIRIAEQTYGKDSPNVRLARKGDLEKYGYTRESFAAACDKVFEKPESWVPFQQAVVDRVDSLLGIRKQSTEDKKKKKKK